MFYRCEPLREIILPKTTTVIAGQAFDQCTSLAKCTFSAGLTTIRQYAFRNTKLTNVELPSTLTAMEAKVFDGCKELTTVTFTSKAAPSMPRRAVPELPETQNDHRSPRIARSLHGGAETPRGRDNRRPRRHHCRSFSRYYCPPLRWHASTSKASPHPASKRP